jgi:homoserine O-acetyltransferase
MTMTIATPPTGLRADLRSLPTPRASAGVGARPLPAPAWAPTVGEGRQYATIGDLQLERGGVLREVTVAFECWGTLNPARDNAVLVEHALTGDAHVVGPAGPDQPSPGWWDGLVGPGAPLDTDRLFVIASNVLGGCQGSTGPASTAPDGRPYGSRFPRITIRDQVAAEVALADRLGIDAFAAVLGGSMGGMRALEWAVGVPDRVRRAVIIASTAAASADQIAWAAPQLASIRLDPNFAGGDYYGGPVPMDGMAIARQIAHTTYRSAGELSLRFGRDAQDGEDPADGGRYAVESYLQYHGAKLGRRFDPNSYLVLTEAMNSHDVGRGRGGVQQALQRVTADTTVAVVDSDRLYLPVEGARIAAAVPGARPLHTIHSEFGHDGFLIEAQQIADVVRAAVTGAR